MLLINKKILIALTGSIAIYKTLELIRLFVKEGAEVRVIMTKGAKKFINPITFEAISENRVLDDESECWDKNQIYNHIDIGKWADIFIVAPASANTINKLANGIADNILLQTALAYTNLKLLVPAANTNMLYNQITQSSLKILKKNGYTIVPTQSKKLVCKDFGNGAMAEPLEIFHQTTRLLLTCEYWKNRKIILSGGGTIEKIDDVRYISNFSSGKMANHLSKALYYLGADVSLVTTRGYENLPNNINLFVIQSSIEMQKKLEKLLNFKKEEILYKKPYLFKVAAVSDFVPEIQEKGKIKKSSLGTSWNLSLVKNIDILKNLKKKDILSVGFKAEMDRKLSFNNAKEMLKNKKLDAVCLNVLDEKISFGSEDNNIDLIFSDTSYNFKGSKLSISFDILKQLQKEFNE